MYLRTTKAGLPDGHDQVVRAFEFALEHMGTDISATQLWTDYINFLKAEKVLSKLLMFEMYMHVYEYVSINECIYARVYLCMCMRVCVCGVYVCMYVPVCVRLRSMRMRSMRMRSMRMRSMRMRTRVCERASTFCFFYFDPSSFNALYSHICFFHLCFLL